MLKKGVHIYFEIVVIKNEKHFFATAKHSITDKEKALEVYEDFLQRFPASEGFKLHVTRYEEAGVILTEEFQKELGEDCDECGSFIPATGGSMANKHHKLECSLFSSRSN